MKTKHLIATLGTLALAVNFLLPGLAFAVGLQTGTAVLDCSATSPTFTIAPDTAFNFTEDGSGTNLTASVSAQFASNNPDGSGLTVTTGNDFIQIEDFRDPSVLNCNNGVTVVTDAVDGSDNDGCIFDANPTDVEDPEGVGGVCDGNDFFIKLTDTYVVSSNDTCQGGDSAGDDGLCFDSAALCGNGDNVEATACNGSDNAATDGETSCNFNGEAFNSEGTYTTADCPYGTGDNTPNVTSTELLGFNANTELFGKAGLGISFGVVVRAGQPSETYVIEFENTVTGS